MTSPASWGVSKSSLDRMEIGDQNVSLKTIQTCPPGWEWVLNLADIEPWGVGERKENLGGCCFHGLVERGNLCRAARMLALAHDVDRLIESGQVQGYADAARRSGITRHQFNRNFFMKSTVA